MSSTKLITVTVNDGLTPTILPQFGSAGDLTSSITVNTGSKYIHDFTADDQTS